MLVFLSRSCTVLSGERRKEATIQVTCGIFSVKHPFPTTSLSIHRKWSYKDEFEKGKLRITDKVSGFLHQFWVCTPQFKQYTCLQIKNFLLMLCTIYKRWGIRIWAKFFVQLCRLKGLLDSMNLPTAKTKTSALLVILYNLQFSEK